MWEREVLAFICFLGGRVADESMFDVRHMKSRCLFSCHRSQPSCKALDPWCLMPTPRQIPTLGFRRAPHLYLARRVYPGGLMLKQEGMEAFQNSFSALTSPLLLFLFRLAAARSGRRDNKPGSFSCLLQHCTDFMADHLK